MTPVVPVLLPAACLVPGDDRVLDEDPLPRLADSLIDIFHARVSCPRSCNRAARKPNGLRHGHRTTAARTDVDGT